MGPRPQVRRGRSRGGPALTAARRRQRSAAAPWWGTRAVAGLVRAGSTGRGQAAVCECAEGGPRALRGALCGGSWPGSGCEDSAGARDGDEDTAGVRLAGRGCVRGGQRAVGERAAFDRRCAQLPGACSPGSGWMLPLHVSCAWAGSAGRSSVSAVSLRTDAARASAAGTRWGRGREPVGSVARGPAHVHVCRGHG